MCLYALQLYSCDEISREKKEILGLMVRLGMDRWMNDKLPLPQRSGTVISMISTLSVCLRM